MAPTKAELTDLFWRAVWTFLAVLGGGGAVGPSLLDIEAWKIVVLSATGAAVTVLTGYARQKAGTIQQSVG